jgi:NADH-quinone oxidoreductase subunit A
MATPAHTGPFWPLILYFVLVIILVVGMVVVSYVLGQRHREPATDTPFESGMLPTGSARLRFPAEFYLIGMFFVIFDLESVFTFAWAIAARDPRVGWLGFWEITVFIVILVAALVYLWRVGALNWGTVPRMMVADPVERGTHEHAPR